MPRPHGAAVDGMQNHNMAVRLVLGLERLGDYDHVAVDVDNQVEVHRLTPKPASGSRRPVSRAC